MKIENKKDIAAVKELIEQGKVQSIDILDGHCSWEECGGNFPPELELCSLYLTTGETIEIEWNENEIDFIEESSKQLILIAEKNEILFFTEYINF